MKKCDYCAKEISYFEQYCSEECQRKANKFYEKREKFEKLFSVINGICIFGIPIGLIAFSFLNIVGIILTGVSCAILGVLLILLPFPTDNMISKHKLEKAAGLTRIIGVGVIVFGIVVCALLYFFFS